MNTKPLVILLSSGLGRISRGYENHIAVLGDALNSENELPFQPLVLCAKRIIGKPYHIINSFSRNNPLLQLLKLSWKKKFQVEQASFLCGMLPFLLIKKPALIYLAEYDLYCWLFKLRELLKLNYGLILYTGGMAVPGLHNNQKDKVHHVTDALLATAERMGIPSANQVVIPHFVNTSFKYDDELIAHMRSEAGKKKIVLVVGAMNTNHKRMDLAARLLGKFAGQVYPFFIGDKTEAVDLIEKQLKKDFKSAYYLGHSSASFMGSYYAGADLFFSASAYESFGMAYIEALWHGLPLFCHQHENLDNVTGGLATGCDMEDEQMTTFRFQTFLDSLPAFRENSLQHHLFVKNLYSWQACKEAYINLLTPNVPQQTFVAAMP